MKSLRNNDAPLEERRRSSASDEKSGVSTVTAGLDVAAAERQDDFELDDADNIDPIDEEILSYLDDELSPEDKAAFEAKLAADPELKRRVDEERDAWSALDLLDVEKPQHDLTETTVERLNSETQTALLSAQSKNKRRRALFISVSACLACVLGILGYAFFSALFPNIETLRQRDCRVVERLPQLEAVESFEYLTALQDADLFHASEKDAFRNSNAAPPQAPNFSETSLFNPNKPDRSYEELAKDRVFYRLQIRFESLDGQTQKTLRALYAQINESPNADKLWSTADAYAFWLETSVNDSERERLYAQSIPDRLKTIREKQEFFERLQDFARRSAPDRRENANAPGDDAQQNDKPRPIDERALRGAPAIVAFRLTLPKQLQDENTSELYKKYSEYRREKHIASSRLEGIFDFIADTSNDELLKTLSQDAQDYLTTKSEAERGSLLGTLVSLSCLESDSHEPENRSQSSQGNPPNPQNEFGGPRMNPQPGAPFNAQNGPEQNGPSLGSGFGFKQNMPNFDRRQYSVRALATTLKNAPDDVKSYVGSNPPPAALAALLGLHWNVTRQFPRPTPGDDAKARQGDPNRPNGPNDAMKPQSRPNPPFTEGERRPEPPK